MAIYKITMIKIQAAKEVIMAKITPFPNTALIEEQASQWIVKFESDEKPSATDIQALNDWLEQSPQHRGILLKFAHNWNDMDVMASLMIPLGQAEKPERRAYDFWSLAPLLLINRLIQWLFKPFRIFSKPWLGLPSAALLVIVFITFSHLNNVDEIPNNIYTTNIGEYSTNTLNDGSVLWLNSNSKVEVIYTTEKRIIKLLAGEAHFKVASQANRPFEVYVGHRMVKAVGTEFSVYRLKDKIEVIVTEGRVDLAVVDSTLLIAPDDMSSASIVKIDDQENLNTNAITVLGSLTAGQSIAIPVSSQQEALPIEDLEPGDLARKLSWLDGRLVFAGESLEEVVAEVSRHTPIVIEVADPKLKKLRIGGQFKAGETDALFDVLESGFGIEINRISEGHVQLNAK